jgi:hypothetical protein
MHIMQGTPMFDDSDCETKPMFPAERLQEIQQMILRAIGYESDHATNEIKRMLHSNTDNVSEFLDDAEVTNAVSQMSNTINELLSRAAIQSTNDIFFNGQHSDGFTRVVSVTYSEKLIDGVTGKEIGICSLEPGLSPSSEIMEHSDGCDDEKKKEELLLARDTSRLKQEILAELLMMRDEERDAKLRDAKIVTNTLLSQALTLPHGSDRIIYLQSISEHEKRLMMMHKLWNSMLAQHDGKQPTMRYQTCVE